MFTCYVFVEIGDVLLGYVIYTCAILLCIEDIETRNVNTKVIPEYSVVILLIRDICKNYFTGNDIQFYFHSSVVSTKIFVFISGVFILFNTITSYNLYLFIPSELMLFVRLLITDIDIRFIIICNLQHELSCLIYLHMQF